MAGQTFQDLIDNRESLIAVARLRAKYEVPVKIRDVDHYIAIVHKMVESVSKNINDWGLTDIVVHELNRTGQPVSTSILIFKEMHDGFNPVLVGQRLENMV